MRLTANLTLLLIFIPALLLTSCKKDSTPGSGNNNIIGDYTFVGTAAHTNSSVTFSEAGSEFKSITVSDYITQNNVGTAKITSGDIIFNGVGYSVDTTMNGKTYVDGVLYDESDMPFVLTVPPTTTTNPYTRINDDSLKVIGALGLPDPSGVTPTGPVGVKISWSGDTLLLKIASSFTQDISQGGMPATLTGFVNGVAKLKKR